MRVRFWGVRGTIPSPGPDTVIVGGNTACVDVLTSDRQLIILDAGSGIRLLGKELVAENNARGGSHGGSRISGARAATVRIAGAILISHTHWDHIQGLPYFQPIFTRNNRFVVVGQKRVGQRLEEILARQMVEPYLPFDYKALPADVHVKEVEHGERFIIGDETVVRVAALNHPGGCLGYRIENAGATLVYCTDTTHPGSMPDPNVVELAGGADLLIHDAHFSLEERARLAHWGHSSWLEAAEAGAAAGVKCLALFHHSPDAGDRYLQEEVLRQAREVFPNTILAQEGMALELPLTGAPGKLW